jgi:hypothetical protein
MHRTLHARLTCNAQLLNIHAVAALRSDLHPVLALVARRLGKTAADLVIYDPYYCAGAVKARPGIPRAKQRHAHRPLPPY